MGVFTHPVLGANQWITSRRSDETRPRWHPRLRGRRARRVRSPTRSRHRRTRERGERRESVSIRARHPPRGRRCAVSPIAVAHRSRRSAIKKNRKGSAR